MLATGLSYYPICDKVTIVDDADVCVWLSLTQAYFALEKGIENSAVGDRN